MIRRIMDFRKKDDNTCAMRRAGADEKLLLFF